MLTISITPSINKVRERLDVAAKQVRFATSQTVNRLARQAVLDVQKQMEKDFDRPTRWTLRGFYAHGGTRDTMTAVIMARDFAGKGTPAWKYLAPEAFGGPRREKRYERALGSKFGTTFTVPGRGARLNVYGNISMGDIEKLLSALGAAETRGGYRANRTVRSGRGRKQETYFLARSHGTGKPLGIYKVVSSGHVEPVIIFVDHAPNYRVRFPYGNAVMTSISENSINYFREELAKALGTAR